MTTVLDQARTQMKDAAYTSIGVNLLVTDAIVGREIKAPRAVAEHAALARKQATEALTGLRGRTEPLAGKFTRNLPEQVADMIITGRTAAWDFIGIDAPVEIVEEPAATKPAAAAKPAAKPAAAKKAGAKKA